MQPSDGRVQSMQLNYAGPETVRANLVRDCGEFGVERVVRPRSAEGDAILKVSSAY
jgi:hypothetical protein